MVNTINNIETYYVDRHWANSCMTIPVIISWSVIFINLSNKAALLNIMTGLKNPWVVRCVYTFKLGTKHGKRVFQFRNIKKRDCSQTVLSHLTIMSFRKKINSRVSETYSWFNELYLACFSSHSIYFFLTFCKLTFCQTLAYIMLSYSSLWTVTQYLYRSSHEKSKHNCHIHLTLNYYLGVPL